ncbi:RpiB/LacA/LacB family sugar-phosphate isomerase [Phaeodactylibacter sp.]|uniref:RpiB/LacA/LacB family sugar-phosphate isomerase n=1 Tax=Phaeodactylibacter sp. TaxID=1940289 RepID=UPI0025CD2B42|nr:RpiB/LacA/LacB family sugar-phosphate isomerase [Phaeodactylibacter sp.]MCI4649602.1 RpiB/LacA/LacB family sugar-phosphate isomerase [Phaeodactylibacter sp.]MCI5093104.1 RpiB/LacA/LacB family sugar-phosphate isomerase [Phaeodactylibacter sp.]
MTIAIGSDMDASLVKIAIEELQKRGHEVLPFGALLTAEAPWPKVGMEVAEAVVGGQADQGIVFCWTGTGVSMAANKVKGARAALCWDAPTAAGARQWNDANILAISLCYTSEALLKEILNAWFGNTPSTEKEDQACIHYLKERDA